LEAEKQIKLLNNNFSKFLIKNLDLKIITQVKNKLALDNLIFANLNCENTDISEIPHKIKLITNEFQRVNGLMRAQLNAVLGAQNNIDIIE